MSGGLESAVTCPNDEHRTRSVADDLLGNRTEQHVLETGAAVRPQNDQIEARVLAE